MLSANSNDGIANLTFDADLNKVCQQSKNLKTMGKTPRGIGWSSRHRGTLSRDIIHTH